MLMAVPLLCGYTFAAVSADLSAEVERGMRLWRIPGMAVAVVDSDRLRFRQGFGATAFEGGVSVDEHTLFALGSTTKAMIAAAILMLADDGAVNLDDPVIEYIPELHFGDPLLTREVTVRDILAHRTGLPSTYYLWNVIHGMELDEKIRRMRHLRPEGPIRTYLAYQNNMYDIAGLIIERASGLRWDRFLTKRLWHPLGMRQTYGTRGQIPNSSSHVLPHRLVDNKPSPFRWNIPLDRADAAGSAWSSIHDMSLWAQFLLRGGRLADGERLISRDRFAQMFEPQQLEGPESSYPTTTLTKPNWRSYGLGWFQQDFQGRKIDYHTGSLDGLTALMGLDRSGDIAIVTLGNLHQAELRHGLLWSLMDTHGTEGRDWHREVFELYESRRVAEEQRWEKLKDARISGTDPGVPLSSFVGAYQSDTDGELAIVQTENTLSLIAGKHVFGMSHWHLSVFLISDTCWDMREFVSFEIGADRLVTGLTVFGREFLRVAE